MNPTDRERKLPMSPLKDAALFGLGAYALHTIGLGGWILWVGGALAASALARAAVGYRRAQLA